MKTIAKLLIFSALFASCERELLESVVSKDGVDVVATKATGVSESADGAGGIDPIKPEFKKGDQISVRLSTEGDHACVEYDGSQLRFPKEEKSYFAVYPYSCVKGWRSNKNGVGPVNIIVPTKQTAINGKLDSKALA